MEISKRVSFAGFNAVVAGQKSSGNNEPQLIVNSTSGKFTITSAVSKAMGIAVGEHIQFINNIGSLEQMIQSGSDDVKAAAEELGVDIESREGQLAFIKAYTQWALVKGQPMLDKVGNPILVSARLSADEKRAYITKNAKKIIEALNDELRATLIERVGDENASVDELAAAIQIDEIDYPGVPGFTGSKTASTSNATGVGLQLGFTDSNVWGALKADLVAQGIADKKNRTFNVLVDEATEFEVDGKKMMAYPIDMDSVKDTDPIVRGTK